MSTFEHTAINRSNFSRPLTLKPEAAGEKRVSSDLFGCNLEHTRANIYTGLSAQMLRNRKFAGKPTACCGTAAEWYPIGEKTVFHLTHENPYTRHAEGYHMRRAHECNVLSVYSPLDALTAGIGQHELTVSAGWSYDFAIVAKTGGPVELNVALTDRGGKAVYCSETISVNAEDWTRYTVKLTSDSTDEDADLRITFTGKGNVFVGAVSLMPENNFRGMRRDVINLMKEMGITILRWPGGNFAGEYSWQDGLLPVDMRAPLQSYLWIETQPHSMGYDFQEMNTDDFVALCHEIGAKPFITINPAWNTPEENAAWVEYCNGNATTKYGKLRAERGFEAPFNVQLWSLGNEFGYGHMEGDNTPTGYCRIATDNGAKMLETDPGLRLCSSGPYPNADWAEKAAKPLGTISPLVSLHFYGHQPMYYGASFVESEYYACVEAVEEMRQLARTQRGLLSDDLKISFDEWNVWYAWYRPSSVTDGIYNALAAQMLIAEAEPCGIELACHFEAVNEGMIRVYPNRAELTAQGQMFKLMKRHAGGQLLFTAPEAVMTRGIDGVIAATVVNASLDQWKDVDFGACGNCAEAKLYSSEGILPPSYFNEGDALAEAMNGAFKMPPHSVLLLRFGG